MMVAEPSITIGILTIPGRLSLLENLAESLVDAVEYYEGSVEVLVAGNGVEEAVSVLNERLQCKVEFVETDGTAPAGRAQLIDTAATDWLLFVDDDCRVDETLLAAYGETIQSATDDVAAIYGPLVFEGQRSVAFEAYRFTPFVHPLQVAVWRDTVEWAPTANAAFSVPDVQAVGNFDTDNPIVVSGEDVDIGLRLKSAGYTLTTAPEAKVYHMTDSWNGVIDNIQRAYTYGLSEAWLAQQYPNRTEPRFGLSTDNVAENLTTIGLLLSVPFLTLPLACLVWLIGLTLRKATTDQTTSIIAYALSDVYQLMNYLGYARETVREGGAIRDLTRRFVFYKHSYVHPRVPKNGVWHNDDE